MVLTVSRVDAIDRQARKGFTYRQEPGDTWRSHADDIFHDRAWQGDCDDLASSCLDMLSQMPGVEMSDLYRLMVSSVGGKLPDHMVAAVWIVDSKAFRIVGDTFRPSYDAAAMKHRCFFYNRMDEQRPVLWRVGAPWEKVR